MNKLTGDISLKSVYLRLGPQNRRSSPVIQRFPKQYAKGGDNYGIVAAIREAEMNNSANEQSGGTDGRYPAAPPSNQVKQPAVRVAVMERDCFRTYGDGSGKRFQAERRYDPVSGDWEYDPGSC